MDMEADQPVELPSDIICHHILPRVPAKSLMRFRCVCKSWANLVRSPSFIAANERLCSNNKNKNTTNLLFCRFDMGVFFSSQICQQENPTPVTQLSNINHCQVCNYAQKKVNVQSINGLVCASSNYNPVSIFNPSTKECIQLPWGPWGYGKQVHAYHFGFSRLSNKYKVLHVAHSFKDGIVKLHILTLGTDSSWRQLHVSLDDFSFETLNKCAFDKSVCLHGAIHWMHKAENIILVFDIEDEKFRVIPLPNSCCSTGYNDYLSDANIVELGGCVAVYADKLTPITGMSFVDGELFDGGEPFRDERKLMLWILKDYQNHVWVEETILMPINTREPYGGRFSDVNPLCTIHTGELAIVVKPLQLLLYNMRSKLFRMHDFDVPESTTEHYSLVTSFDDSLVPLNRDGLYRVITNN